MKWFREMVTGDKKISHKRIISVISFIVLLSMVVVNYIAIFRNFEKPIDESLIYTFAGLCVGESMLTVSDKFFKK